VLLTGTRLLIFKFIGGITDFQCGAGNLVSKGEGMKDKTVIQDYLFSSALVFKTVAIFITLYALDNYACLVYERNLVTRLLLRNDLAFFFAEMAGFTFICIGYSRVRKTYRMAYKKAPIRWSFNALVGFVFLTYLWDAANDAIILLAASLRGVQG
jgi:hypothetical protein